MWCDCVLVQRSLSGGEKKGMLGRLLERVAQRPIHASCHKLQYPPPPKTAVMQAFASSVSVKKNEGHTRGVSRPLAKATRHTSLS